MKFDTIRAVGTNILLRIGGTQNSKICMNPCLQGVQKEEVNIIDHGIGHENLEFGFRQKDQTKPLYFERYMFKLSENAS